MQFNLLKDLEINWDRKYLIWSPPIDHLINYIAFLSKKKGYSSATAKSYISGISYKIKINNLEDRLNHSF